MTYLFVGGSERSGTSLLHNLLCSDESTIPAIAEATLFRFMVEAYQRGKQQFEVRGRDYFTDIEAYRTFHSLTALRFLESTRNRYPPATHVVLKEPVLTRSFPDLWELLPAAKFVTIVRDPRDTVCSLAKVAERLGGQQHWLAGAAHDMVRLCQYYRWFYQPVLHCKDPAFRANLCFVKYEDMVLNTAAAIDDLCRFTQLDLSTFDPENPWQHNRLDYAGLAALDGYRPWYSELRGKALSTGSVGTYRDQLSAEDVAIVERECADILERFRYGAAR